MAGLTRRFDGKVFTFFDSSQEKKEVEDMAKEAKAKGQKFRITHYKKLPYFELWVLD